MGAGRSRTPACGRFFLLSAVLCLAAAHARAAAPEVPEIKRKPYTVLQITRYDGTVSYEVMKSKEVGLRAKEVYAEYPIWEEAHRLAKLQWNEWFREKTPENAGREWTLPKPRPPRFTTVGVYEDEFDAEDKVKALNSAENEKLYRVKKQLRQQARYSRKALAYLDNMEENRKLVRELIPEVHETMLAKDRRIVAYLSERKKKTIWNLAHVAQQKAEMKLRENSKDENDRPVEPDAVDLYETVQKAIEPILKRYRVTERQYNMIWEDGYMNEWPIPKVEEAEQIEKVAAEVDKEKDAEPPPEEAGEKPAADAGAKLEELETLQGLEKLDDPGKQNGEEKKEPKPQKKRENKEGEKEPQPEKKLKQRRDWW